MPYQDYNKGPGFEEEQMAGNQVGTHVAEAFVAAVWASAWAVA